MEQSNMRAFIFDYYLLTNEYKLAIQTQDEKGLSAAQAERIANKLNARYEESGQPYRAVVMLLPEGQVIPLFLKPEGDLGQIIREVDEEEKAQAIKASGQE